LGTGGAFALVVNLLKNLDQTGLGVAFDSEFNIEGSGAASLGLDFPASIAFTSASRLQCEQRGGAILFSSISTSPWTWPTFSSRIIASGF
jgi:hypothetical protein